MIGLLNVVLLGGLVKLLIESEKPFLCSSLYAFAGFVTRLMFGSFLDAFIGAVVLFVFASIYFWILDRLPLGEPLWWIVFAGGALTCFL